MTLMIIGKSCIGALGGGVKDQTSRQQTGGCYALGVVARSSHFLYTAVIVLLVALSGCNDGESSDPQSLLLETELRAVVDGMGLTGDPATPRGLVQKLPSEDAMVKLGQLLFFSHTLSAGYDVSCGTCHHPDFGGSDGLSIGVGVVPTIASAVGPGRTVDPLRDLDASADGGPNMHRHSITTFNAALNDRVLLYDGRVRVADAEITPGGHGQAIITNESAPSPDADAVSGLLAMQAKGPMVTNNEMRNFAYSEYAFGSDYRQHLVRRLKGEVDTEYNTIELGPENWLERFRSGFDLPEGTADELITMANIQKALAAYVASEIFVDTPWRSYLSGDANAISDEAKRGALLFYRPLSEAGLGCGHCHSGDRFTDENFYNVGFPQFGRGFGFSDTSDFGRWLTTREESDRNAFRAITLLNIAVTAPYGHAGSFGTLEQTILYHADPRSGVERYDFTLSDLPQFMGTGIRYPDAETRTRAAIAQPSFDTAEALLPARPLSDSETRAVLAFLNALTDRCVKDLVCINQWTPDSSEDPDGHLLVRDVSGPPPILLDPGNSGDYPKEIHLAFPALESLPSFADVRDCTDSLATAFNSGLAQFVYNNDSSFGLGDPHGYAEKTWFSTQRSPEITMMAGGVSSAYLNDDCWPDLIFTGGDLSGMKFYRNVQGQMFESLDSFIAGNIEREFTGSAVADLNGDYRREIILGNIKGGEIPVFASNGSQQYEKVAALPMSRPTFGISFAPLDATGYPYFYLGHWSGGSGIEGTAPALWKNDGQFLRPWDNQAGTSSEYVNQSFNFTPKFADFTADGKPDLVVASDFSTSQTLRNVAPTLDGPLFTEETRRSIITDENGMGSTLLDIDNDGGLEWLVSSIYDPDGVSGNGTNWGVSGNRLYRNVSTADGIAFEDITDQAGVRFGFWGWGACAADFNNDGFSDIFHVNGYGYIPDNVVTTDAARERQALYITETESDFQHRPGVLFINNGNGTFTDRTTDWGIDVPSEGRGVTCVDFDRDGDIDIALFDHSTGLQFFENQVGHGTNSHFLNVRLVGAPPNTDALGAKVYVIAKVGGGSGQQTQMRLSQANSNFNSQDVPDLHFGLGQASTVDELRIEWPGGAALVCSSIPVNQFVVFDEREGTAACP